MTVQNSVQHAQLHPQQNPADINGDLRLSPDQLAAYLQHHEVRNRENARRSRAEGVRTSAIPLSLVDTTPTSSPARVMVSAFFSMAARRLAPSYKGREVTMFDLGCGTGNAVLPFFEEAGLRGRYIGLDIKGDKRFPTVSSRSFSRELIIADIHTFDVGTLPPIDLFVSATALEHIRDDADAVARLTTRLAPGGAQVHYIPGEAALKLYGQHGWRQYSPRCLRALFPEGDLYRAGGHCSNALHERAITRGAPDHSWRSHHPQLYRHLRNASLVIDRVLGNQPSTMYGVIVPPGRASSNGALGRRAA